MSTMTHEPNATLEPAQRNWLVKMGAVLRIPVTGADHPPLTDINPDVLSNKLQPGDEELVTIVGVEDPPDSGTVSGEKQTPTEPVGEGALESDTPTEDDDPEAAKHESQVLLIGSNGAAVEHLQKKLHALGDSLEVDGKFGPITQKAVMNFQTSKGLKVDGIVGPKTWAALKATAPRGSHLKKPPRPPNPNDRNPRKATFTVADDKNSPIPKATVTLINLVQLQEMELVDTSAPTDGKGHAIFFMRPSKYRIEVTAEGFNKVSGTVELTQKPQSFSLRMRKTPVGETTTTLKLAPPKRSHSEQEIIQTATVVARDTRITLVGEVLFEVSLNRAGLTKLGRVPLKSGTAIFKFSKWPKGSHQFHATFKPTPPVPGSVESNAVPVDHRVYSKQEEEEFSAFLKTLRPKVDAALVSGRDFTPDLEDERRLVVTFESDVTSLAKVDEFVKALAMARNNLEPKVDDYLRKAKEEEKTYEKVAEDIEARLKKADKKHVGDVAKDIATELAKKPQELKHLPLKTRNSLLQSLQKEPFKDDRKKAAKILMSVPYLDPEFEKQNKEKCSKLVEKMKSDPAYKTARDQWQQESFTTRDRLAILQKAIDDYADVFGIPKTKVGQFSEPFSDEKPSDLGRYSHPGKVMINIHDSALKMQSFDDALDTAVHEMAHRQQSFMADDITPHPPKPAKIPTSDPLFNQAKSFKLNDAQLGFYVEAPGKPPPSEDKGDEYFTQPEETHSRVTGAAIAAGGIGKS